MSAVKVSLREFPGGPVVRMYAFTAEGPTWRIKMPSCRVQPGGWKKKISLISRVLCIFTNSRNIVPQK